MYNLYCQVIDICLTSLHEEHTILTGLEIVRIFCPKARLKTFFSQTAITELFADQSEVQGVHLRN